MLVAIVHYHLNRGGVTQVIANQLRALQIQAAEADPMRVVILHGGRAAGWPDRAPDAPWLGYTTEVVDGLDYHDRQDRQDRPRGAGVLAAGLRTALQRAGGSTDRCVIHVHNHSLGKNPMLWGALGRLARDGWPLLLQIHDFAEDFRPENYGWVSAGAGGDRRGETLRDAYPSAAHIHYAVLNSRDARILAAVGVETDRLHVLPNAVGDIGPLPSGQAARRGLARKFGIPEHRRWLLYPVRGIRRKNLGEALLWSALAGDGWQVGLTLAPATPAERPSYQRWKQVAGSLQLPVAFELGEQSDLSFGDTLSAADRMLTTSVAEGFGLVFLESWLAGKTLVGRDLPEITADFLSAGLRLDQLRPRLDVPLDWIGAAQWRRQFEQAYTRTLARLGRPATVAGDFHRVLDRLTADGWVDFAALPSDQQQEVIRQVVESGDRRERLRSRNAWIEDALCGNCVSDAVAHNAAAVRATYSLAACGRKLAGLYRQVVSSPRGEEVRPLVGAERILDEFLQPERFHPIRVEP
jgi:hypothetical protein